jgi:DNA-binding CsgD family transcriptional regulator
MTPSDPHELTRLLYQSVVDPSKWSHAIAQLADFFGAGHVLVGLRKGGEEPIHLSARLDEEHLREFWIRLDESEFRDYPSLMPVGTFIASAAVYDPRVYVRSDFYQAVVRPMGGHHACLALPFRAREDRSFIAVCRSLRQGEFPNGVLSKLQGLMPHLQSSLGLHRRLSQQSREVWHRESVLDRLDVGVVLLDKRQRTLLANRRARELLGSSGRVKLRPDGLESPTSELSRRIQRLVGKAIQAREHADATLWLRVDRPGSTPLLLRAVPIARQNVLDASARAAVALFIDTIGEAKLDHGLLRAWFGFSAREAELAAWLAAGKDLSSTARAMKIGHETARTHLDKVFAKTGTRRQAELVSLLLRTAWRL